MRKPKIKIFGDLTADVLVAVQWLTRLWSRGWRGPSRLLDADALVEDNSITIRSSGPRALWAAASPYPWPAGLLFPNLSGLLGGPWTADGVMAATSTPVSTAPYPRSGTRRWLQNLMEFPRLHAFSMAAELVRASSDTQLVSAWLQNVTELVINGARPTRSAIVLGSPGGTLVAPDGTETAFDGILYFACAFMEADEPYFVYIDAIVSIFVVCSRDDLVSLQPRFRLPVRAVFQNNPSAVETPAFSNAGWVGTGAGKAVIHHFEQTSGGTAPLFFLTTESYTRTFTPALTGMSDPVRRDQPTIPYSFSYTTTSGAPPSNISVPAISMTGVHADDDGIWQDVPGVLYTKPAGELFVYSRTISEWGRYSTWMVVRGYTVYAHGIMLGHVDFFADTDPTDSQPLGTFPVVEENIQVDFRYAYTQTVNDGGGNFLNSGHTLYRHYDPRFLEITALPWNVKKVMGAVAPTIPGQPSCWYRVFQTWNRASDIYKFYRKGFADETFNQTLAILRNEWGLIDPGVPDYSEVTASLAALDAFEAVWLQFGSYTPETDAAAETFISAFATLLYNDLFADPRYLFFIGRRNLTMLMF